jgi:hypothetical protein
MKIYPSDASSHPVSTNTSSSEKSGELALSSWSTTGTDQLWGLYQKWASVDAVGALCSRFALTRGATPTGNAPNLQQIRLWLDDPNESVRAACALGLSLTSPHSVRPQLVQHYFSESSTSVRAALVHALRAQLGVKHPLLASIAALDANLMCRKLAGGENLPELGFFIRSDPSEEKIITHLGRTRYFDPAPDGFAAVVDPGL